MLLSALMSLEVLLEKTIVDSYKNLVQIVIMQINLLLSVLNDSLDLAALQESKFEKKKESFSPHQVIDFVVRLFQPLG